jgi:hypothetical protein
MVGPKIVELGVSIQAIKEEEANRSKVLIPAKNGHEKNIGKIKIRQLVNE